jgi:hypothetical protein
MSAVDRPLPDTCSVRLHATGSGVLTLMEAG